MNDSDYDFEVRNGNTDRNINMIVGTIGCTPEICLSDANVNLLGHLVITHSIVSTREIVRKDNPDSDAMIFFRYKGC